MRDPATWRDLAWLLVNGTVGVTLVALAFGLWASIAWHAVLPLLWMLIPQLRGGLDYAGGSSTGATRSTTRSCGGSARWPRGWRGAGHRRCCTNARVVRWLLAPSERTRLERRVDHLAESRADSVDAQALELRRIERDLHAGRPWPDRRGPRIRAGPAAPGRRGRHADRVFDVDQFIDAVRRVAGGGTVMDPEVVAQLLSRRQRDEPLAELTPREREVLGLMAEGRSNAASVDGCSSPTRPSASTSTASSASSACPLR